MTRPVPPRGSAPVTYTVEEFRSLVLPRLMQEARGVDGDGPEFASVTERGDGAIVVEVAAPSGQRFVLFAGPEEFTLPPMADEADAWKCDWPGCGAVSMDTGLPLYRCDDPRCGFTFPADELPDMSANPESGLSVNVAWEPGMPGSTPWTVGDAAARNGLVLEPADVLERRGAAALLMPPPGEERCPVDGSRARMAAEFSCVDCGRGGLESCRAVICPDCGHVLGQAAEEAEEAEEPMVGEAGTDLQHPQNREYGHDHDRQPPGP